MIRWEDAPVVGVLVVATGGVTRVKPAPAKPALSGTTLRQGDTLVLKPGAKVRLVLLRDGTLSELSGPDTLVATGARWVSRKPARPLRKIDLRLLAPGVSVGERQGATLERSARAGGISLRIAAPRGLVRSLETSLRLRWTATGLPANARVDVSLYDGEGRAIFRKRDVDAAAAPVLADVAVSERSWYRWRVECLLPSGDTIFDETTFALLSDVERRALADAEAVAGAWRKASPTDPAPEILLGRLQERIGMLEQARASYETARKKAPGDRGIVEALARLEKRP